MDAAHAVTVQKYEKNETDLAAAARQPVQSHLNDDVGGKEKKGSNS